MKFRLALAAVAALALSGCTFIDKALDLPDTPAQTNASIKAEGAAASSSSSGGAVGATSPVAQATSVTMGAAAVPSGAEKIVFDIRAGYDAVFLAPASHYRQLPICGSAGAGTICARTDVIVQLQKADTAAAAALDAAEAIARGKQQGTFTNALAIANAAIGAAEKIIATYKIS